MKSLQGRLTLGLVVSLILVFMAQWALVGMAQRRLLQDYVLTRLGHDAESLLGGLSFAPDGGLNADPAHTAGIFRQPFSGHYFVVRSDATELRSRSLWDETLNIPLLPAGEVQVLRLYGPEHQPLLVRVAGYRKQDRPITVATAEDLTHIEADVRRFQWQHALVSVGVLLVLIAVQRLIVRRSLRPVEGAREDVQRLGRGELTAVREEVPAEVQPLVREINRLLVTVERRLQRSRSALGNLAHALKAPLTLLRQSSETRELAACPELRAQIREQIDALQRIIDRELKRARTAGEGGAAKRLDPALEVPPLLDAMRRIHADKHLDIGFRVADAPQLAMDREDFIELLGNLVDNACKWARERVQVSVLDAAAPRIVVEDDGPGAPEAQLAQLGRRGVRADERTPGHGIGLAVVGDIAHSYGGELRLGRSGTLGGFRAEVRLSTRSG